jgi:hypothetical protein
MKSKKLSLMIASVFTFLFLMTLASATITLSSVSDLSQKGSSFAITVTSNQNETVTLSAPSISDGNGHYVTFTPISVPLNTTVSSATVTVPYSVQSGFNFEFEKTYATTLNATGTNSTSVPLTLTFVKSGFCDIGNPGDVSVKVSDLNVKSGFGEDNEWLPLDQVEVTFNIKNRGDEDLNNIVVEWGLYDTNTNTWAIEVTDEKEIDLNNGDDKDVVVTFTLDDKMDEDLSDLQDGTYTIYVRATGEIDNASNMDTCATASKDGKIVIERNVITLSNWEFPESVQCGSDFHLSADVWNIGSKDQSNVYAMIVNKELGINQRVEIGDVNSFENELLDFSYTLADDAKEKSYPLTITLYDEDNDILTNDYNDNNAVFTKSFKVEGGCAKPEASVTASLYSGGQAGKPLVVKATVVNTGTKQTPYILNAAGYTPWASSAKVEPTSFTLNAGETKDVLITFDVNKDAAGDQLFNLEILSGNVLVANQPVQVPIKKAGLSLPSLSLDNWHLWAIGALNLILVIFIIVIAVRISRK